MNAKKRAKQAAARIGEFQLSLLDRETAACPCGTVYLADAERCPECRLKELGNRK